MISRLLYRPLLAGAALLAAGCAVSPEVEFTIDPTRASDNAVSRWTRELGDVPWDAPPTRAANHVHFGAGLRSKTFDPGDQI